MPVLFKLKKPRRIKIKRPPLGKSISLAYANILNQKILDIYKKIKVDVLPDLERIWKDFGFSNISLDAKEYNPTINLPNSILAIFLQIDIIFNGLQFGEDGIKNLASIIAKKADDYFTDDIRASLKRSIAINVLEESPALLGVRDNFVRENIDLIKNLQSNYKEDIFTYIQSAYTDGTRAEQLADILQARTGVTQSRAMLISRDQINKVRSQVRQTRHQELGISSYIWRAVGDVRTRPSHADLDGKTFKYTNHPSVGAPGTPILCRCWDEPIIFTSF